MFRHLRCHIFAFCASALVAFIHLKAQAEAPCPQVFRRGDTNTDGSLDISDPISTIRFLFLETMELPCLDAADANDDGIVSLTDVVVSLNSIVLATVDLPPPGIECGQDPTPDKISCLAYLPCQRSAGAGRSSASDRPTGDAAAAPGPRPPLPDVARPLTPDGAGTRQPPIEDEPGQGASLVLTSPVPPPALLGAAYSFTLTTAGGTGVATTWRIVEGQLPDGLTLSFSQGCLKWGGFKKAGDVYQGLGSGKLTEISGVVESRRSPGILWMHDDSGAGPEFYALNRDGSFRQAYRMDTSFVDLEDISLGPGPDPTKEYIYLADVGDNARSRASVKVVRVEEPIVPAASQPIITLPYERFYARYPGGPRDCETMLVDWETGTPYLLQKEGAGGHVYKFPMPLDPRRTSSNPVDLIQVTTTPILPSTLTGGDASRDGRRIIVRNYGAAYEYVRPAGGNFDSVFFAPRCNVSIIGNQQYEAVCYSDDGASLYTVTERGGQATAPLYVSVAATGATTATISGTPQRADTFRSVLEVMDSSGDRARQEVQMVVTSGQEIVIETRSLPDGAVNLPYEASVTTSGGSSGDYAWSLTSGSLAPGLTLEPAAPPGGCLRWGVFERTGTLDAGLTQTGVLTEVSGVAVSRTNPGVLWVHDDSDRQPVVYALAEDGTFIAGYRLLGMSTNIDWEDIALGPDPRGEGDRLYIGDIGDNSSSRPSRALYRIVEPKIPDPLGTTPEEVPCETFQYTYPDGPRNAETLFVDWRTGTPYVIDKREGGASVYRFPMPLDATATVTLVKVAQLAAPLEMLTAGDATRDARHVVLRNHLGAFELASPPSAALDEAFRTAPCAIDTGPASNLQYDAVGIGPEGTSLYTILEGAAGGLWKASALNCASATRIRGVPTVAGEYRFTVEVTDSAGARGTRELVLTIQDPCQ